MQEVLRPVTWEKWEIMLKINWTGGCFLRKGTSYEKGGYWIIVNIVYLFIICFFIFFIFLTTFGMGWAICLVVLTRSHLTLSDGRWIIYFECKTLLMITFSFFPLMVISVLGSSPTDPDPNHAKVVILRQRNVYWKLLSLKW